LLPGFWKASRSTELCREFGISRKTGYKIFDRYKEEGPVALNHRSWRPVRYANQLPEQVERLVVSSKREKLNWGARKFRELLCGAWPATSGSRRSVRFPPCWITMAW
jgi:transposase